MGSDYSDKFVLPYYLLRRARPLAPRASNLDVVLTQKGPDPLADIVREARHIAFTSRLRWPIRG
jgi:hypothetical protein